MILEQEKRIAVRDSLYAIIKKKYELSDPQLMSKLASEKDSVLQQLKKDSHFFEKTKNVVCAVLNRFRKQWTD